MSTRYTSKEILRTARWAVKGIGRYLRWELSVGGAHTCLLVFYRDKDGNEKTCNVAI